VTPARDPRGFSLVEVMIAVAITAVVGAMAAGAFQRASASRQTVEEQDERISGARSTLTRMASELSMAFLSDNFDRRRFRDRPTVFRGRDGGDRDRLSFATMAHVRGVRDAKESDQMVVGYEVDRDPDAPGDYALFRTQKNRIDDEPDRDASRAAMLSHVTGFDVSYWDWQKQDWVREWSTAPGDRTFLPIRVRVKLTLRMPDGQERPFETQARISIIRPLDF
jgi:general secretion pathway protein J